MVNELGQRSITGFDEGLERLAAIAIRPTIESAVESARDLLGMDVVYATEITQTEQLFHVLRGEGTSFGIHEGMAMPLEQTYCRRILAGELPAVIPDVRADEIAGAMPVTETADVGSFTSVPVRFSDGRLYGTLCAASHEARSDLGERERRFLEVFARMIADQVEREMLAAEVLRSELQAATISGLTAALSARDHYTALHSRAVVEHAGGVARRLELSAREIDEVRQVALLHDIGKIAIPDALLGKRGPLSAEEWETMRTHPIHGERLVAGIEGLGHLATAVRAEHERWDGAGYPDGLRGEEIPHASRIVLACDAYHAMRSDRPYRPAMSEEAARQEIRDGLGSQFCPRAGRALLEALESNDTRSSQAPGPPAA